MSNTKTSAISSIKKISKTNKVEDVASKVSNPKVSKELVEKVTPRNKKNLVENVISHREVKYKYPEDVVDTLSRKSWRQKTRDDLNRLKLALLDIKDQNSKEYKAALKKLNDLEKQVLKAA